jgi:hypothetical protein
MGCGIVSVDLNTIGQRVLSAAPFVFAAVVWLLLVVPPSGWPTTCLDLGRGRRDRDHARRTGQARPLISTVIVLPRTSTFTCGIGRARSRGLKYTEYPSLTSAQTRPVRTR